MTKKGMEISYIRNKIRSKDPKQQIKFLEGIIKRGAKVLNSKTKSAVYEVLGDVYFRKGRDMEADNAYSKAGTKSAYLKQAKLAEKNKFYAHAAADLMDAGISEKQAYIKVERAAEKNGDFDVAARFSLELGNKEKAVELLEKEQTKIYSKTIDYIISALMLWGGLISALILSIKPKVVAIGAMGQQLAPPMPSYWIFVFLGVFILGMVYFIIRAKTKRRGSVPLSF